MPDHGALPSSFRDPSGFLFQHETTLYRAIDQSYASDYEMLMSNGLYKALVKAGLLISHEEIENHQRLQAQAWKVIKPKRIDYISYPYEWCFSQLREAALATIRIQRIAMKFGMVLKDASAYNIQFHEGRAVFIDTLSFRAYRPGEPWVAYKQYCQHFLAPLALMAHTDVRLSQLLRNYIDGIPLDLASALLPRRSYLRLSLLSHIHLHARAQNKYAGSDTRPSQPQQVKQTALEAMLKQLEGTTRALKWRPGQTEWGAYYSATNYDEQAMTHKERLVAEYLGELAQQSLMVHDLGGNNGHFARIAAAQGYRCTAQDIDPVAVESNYAINHDQKQQAVLPLLSDLTNPSPAIGWSLSERMSIIERVQGNIVMALALVHHLAISNNVPLPKVAKFFADCSSHLIIEFVPKQDSQVQRLLASRKDIFDDYDKAGFERAFTQEFEIVRQTDITDSARTLYLMRRKDLPAS